MFRLKTNKTSLYKLVANYEALPSMWRVTFFKSLRQPNYWLAWTSYNGLQCSAYFAACIGKPLLAIEKKEFDGPLVSRVVYELDAKDLLERGMVEEFTTAEERRRMEGRADCGAV